MTQLQWDVYFALLDGAMPGVVSQSRSKSKSKSLAQPESYVVVPDDEFEKLLDQAVEALPPAAAVSGEGTPSRDDLRTYLEYKLVDDPAVLEDCVGMLVRNGERENLAQVLHLLT